MKLDWSDLFLLGQASEGQDPAVIIWVIGGLLALWIALKVFKVLTGLVARVIWFGALIAGVVWVVWTLAGH